MELQLEAPLGLLVREKALTEYHLQGIQREAINAVQHSNSFSQSKNLKKEILGFL